MTLEECIRLKLPFECDDWAVLIDAFTNAYDPSWARSLPDLIASLCDLHKVFLNRGSWNIPLIYPVERQTGEEIEAYKVFLSPKEHKGEHVQYEFHPSTVPMNTWIEAEISGSQYLYGISAAHGGRFHMLLDETQANAYLKGRDYTSEYYSPVEPCIFKVKAKEVTTIDLVYSPPTSFMWGIDSRQMFVDSNQLKTI